MPICAVLSINAANPVVDPSAAMSKVASGCCDLNCSANCGTNFAPSVSEPLMTRRSAFVVAEEMRSAADAKATIVFFMRVWFGFNCATSSAGPSDNRVKSWRQKNAATEMSHERL